MSFIVADMIRSDLAINSGIFSGAMYVIDPNFTSGKRIYPPIATSTVERYGSGDNYENSQYIVGLYSANVVVDEEFRCHRQGMRPPIFKPTVSAGAGSLQQTAYLRFRDSLTRERSPLSSGFAFTGDENRSWSLLPTEVPGEIIKVEGTATFTGASIAGSKSNYGQLRPGDRIAKSSDLTRWGRIRSISSDFAMVIDDTSIVGAGVTLKAKPVTRADQVELWLSVQGSLPRLVMRVPLGTTDVSESVGSLELGEAETVSFQAMPTGTINLFYNDRQLIAGVEGARNYVYLSAIGFPERWEGLRFKTKYGEKIVGMYRHRDYVVVLCENSSYRLQGYVDDDMVMPLLEAKMGGIGHHGNAATDTVAIVPGRKSPQIFNGAFHPAMPNRRSEWSVHLKRRKAAFEMGLGVVNPDDETYHFIPWPLRRFSDNPAATVSVPQEPLIFVGSYQTVGSEAGGGITTPEWTNDNYFTGAAADGFETYAAYMAISGSNVGHFYRGDSLGRIFQELSMDIDEDFNIPHNATSVIVPAHAYFNDLSAEPEDGKELVQVYSHVVSEHSAWRLNIWAGESYSLPWSPNTVRLQDLYPRDPGDSLNPVVPGYFDDVDASYSSYVHPSTGQNVVRQALCTHLHRIAGKPIVGRGFTFEYRFTNPANVKFIGFGGYFVAGRVGARNTWRISEGE